MDAGSRAAGVKRNLLARATLERPTGRGAERYLKKEN